MPKILRVLIVDDEPSIRGVLKKILCGDPDSVFACQAVGTFEECLEVCEEGGADYIILDLCLPDRSALEGLKELREEYPDIGVIVLTARDNHNDAMRAVNEYNALAYIVKPILSIEQFYKAFSDAIIRHESQRKVNTKVSKKTLTAWIGIISSLLALLMTAALFGEKIVGWFK